MRLAGDYVVKQMQDCRKERDSYTEVFRIILMGMIVFWHFILYGVPTYHTKPLLLILTTLTHVAVPCFVLISGWYGIRPSINGFMRLLGMVIFYSILGWLFRLVIGQECFSLRGMFSALFPLFHNRWWFISVYLGLYLTAPILDSFIRSASSQSLFVMILLLYFISFWIGSRSVHVGRLPLFWTLYLIGRAFRFSQDLWRSIQQHSILTYALCAMSIIVVGCTSPFWGRVGMTIYSILFFNYTAPVLLLASIALSLLFLRRGGPWRSRFVNTMAASVFPIYLMHEKNFIPQCVYDKFGEMSHGSACYTIAWGVCTTLFVLTICSCIDCLFRPMYSNLSTYAATLISRIGKKASVFK